MTRQTVASVLCLGLLLASVSSTHAAPISYDIFFEVDSYTSQQTPVDPRVEIGDIYKGSFTVDDSILLVDGLNRAGLVSAFSITMEDANWDLARPAPDSFFAGFRGPAGLGGPSPGFDVVGGQITNLRGGVFGTGDYPFVDFSYDFRYPLPPCAIGDSYCGNSPNRFNTLNPLGAFAGVMTIASPVPEPENYAMLLLGLGVVGFVSRRRLRDRT